ncbi:MAG: hypothetical protein IJN31_06555, partial [Peptococcaceae bacterium]|nr:hypothetical protein [Peptococcaceae bacterium]
TTEWADTIFAALKALDLYSLTQRPYSTAPSFYCHSIPEQILPLRDAFYAPKKQISWHQAAGTIAGQFILRYPPGIPLVVPGERITADIVQLWLSAGGTEDEMVTVINL